MFEFQFTMTDDIFYITHDTNTIDNELLQFLISIDFEFNKVKSFIVNELQCYTYNYFLNAKQNYTFLQTKLKLIWIIISNTNT